MLQVSMGSLISLVIIMLLCFVLPLVLFYMLYRYADGKVKTLGIGAAAYIACGMVADTALAMLFEMISSVETNVVTYLLYSVVLSPVLFILLNYFIIKRFGLNNMQTTGDAMMYSLGYSSAYNVLSTGLVAIMYFFTLLDVKNCVGQYLVVSDADYVSASNTVSASNLVNETVYRQIVKLCGQPVSYYMIFCINCLWVIAAYAAVLMVIWLAVKKTNKILILAFALIIRLFTVMPDILDRFKVFSNVWASQAVSVVVLAIVWIGAIFCRRTFIDSEDAE